MATERPTITFRASTRTRATAHDVYRVLSDLSTHMVWGGEQTGDRRFRLLTLAPPPGPAIAGTRFTSTGLIPMGTFHDESVVVEATPARTFAFRTESTLVRKHRPALIASYDNRYTIGQDGGDTTIDYTCDGYPHNYVPWWVTPLMRPMTRFMVQRTLRRCVRNIAALAEAAANPVAVVPDAGAA